MEDEDFKPRDKTSDISKIPRADFRNRNLSHITLSDVTILCADFSGSDLTGVKFIRANLRRCDFLGASMTGATFIDCLLAEVDLPTEFSITVSDCVFS